MVTEANEDPKFPDVWMTIHGTFAALVNDDVVMDVLAQRFPDTDDAAGSLKDFVITAMAEMADYEAKITRTGGSIL
jgi:hypothetical protein